VFGFDLGPFRLDEPIASGGMGEVWSGRHRSGGTQVAVKLLLAGAMRNAFEMEALRNEIRAVASMDHPHIVWIHDHGTIPPDVAAAAGGRWQAGAPYLVMELADRGLADHVDSMAWSDCAQLVRSLLEALAHAHARGVLHCDLKPGNVLRLGERWLLADFGLAKALAGGPELSTTSVAGTPAYMAPEQFLDDKSAQGPPTDLYALACLVYRIVSGTTPFASGTWSEAWRAHMTDPPAPLRPRFPVPAQLEDWLSQCLCKRPSDRFALAADAASAFDALDSPGAHWVSVSQTARPELQTSRDIPTEPFTGDTTTERAPSLTDPLVRPTVTSVPRTPTGCPDDWRAAGTPRPRPLPLPGAGLALVGLRAVPVVGRAAERDELWQALRTVHSTRSTRTIVLTGPAGTGKSHLARWLTIRSAEVGAARAVWARHSRIPGSESGLQGLLARALRCSGLGWQDALPRLETQLRHMDAVSIRVAASIAYPHMEGRPEARISSARERLRTVADTLLGLAEDRTRVVWLDDVQWGLEAIALAHLLQQSPRGRLLFVLTAQSEALADQAEASAALDALLELDGCSSCPLPPLPPADQRDLIRGLLQLGPAVAARIEERTGGNPLMAVQLIGDLKQRQVLVAGPDGFTVAPGADAPMPEGLWEVWANRVSRWLAGRPESWRLALQIAALLGTDVDTTEWQHACAATQVAAPPDLPAALREQGLAVPHTNGWSFVHGMLREAIQAQAEETGNAAALHRACATALEELSGEGAAERIGMHLLAAGDPVAAAKPLVTGAERRHLSGQSHVARRILALRDGALTTAGVPADFAGWAEGWFLESRVDLELGDKKGAGDRLRHIRAEAEKHGWTTHLRGASISLARIQFEAGAVQEAMELLHAGMAQAQTAEDDRLIASATHDLGLYRYYLGHTSEARDLIQGAIAGFRKSGHPLGIAQCEQQLALMSIGEGEPEDAEVHVERAAQIFEELGHRRGVAVTKNLRGGLAELAGDLRLAERRFQQAVDMHQAIGSRYSAQGPVVNLALLSLRLHPPAEALERLGQALAFIDAQGAGRGSAYLLCGMCQAAARSGLEAAWDRSLTRLTQFLETPGNALPHYAEQCEVAATCAAEAGWPDRAKAAFGLAHRQWLTLGRPEAAEALAGHV